MSPVAARIVNDFSPMTRMNSEGNSKDSPNKIYTITTVCLCTVDVSTSADVVIGLVTKWQNAIRCLTTQHDLKWILSLPLDVSGHAIECG